MYIEPIYVCTTLALSMTYLLVRKLQGMRFCLLVVVSPIIMEVSRTHITPTTPHTTQHTPHYTAHPTPQKGGGRILTTGSTWQTGFHHCHLTVTVVVMVFHSQCFNTELPEYGIICYANIHINTKMDRASYI